MLTKPTAFVCRYVLPKSARLYLLTAIVAPVLSLPTWAVSTEAVVAGQHTANPNTVVEEVTVTATKREQNIQDVAMSITVVQPLKFTKAGFTSIRDISGYVSGFTFYDGLGGPRGTGSVSARGVGQQGATSVVGIYLDDVPMSSNSPFTANFFSFFDGLLADIEQVEMLKGPQGTLYGATTIGGAIKFVSRKPSLDRLDGQASFNTSSTKNGGLNKIYSGRISLPLINKRLGLSLSGFYEDNAGFVDRVDRETGTQLQADADSFDSRGFSADMFFSLSDQLDLRAKVLQQETEYNGFSTVNLDIEKNPIYRPLAGNDILSSNIQENTVYSTTVVYRFDWAALTATSSYLESSLLRVNDLTSGLAAYVDNTLQGNPPGTTKAVPVVTDQGSEKFTQEFRLTSRDNNSWEWIAGLYYTEEDAFYAVDATAQPTGFLLLKEQRPNNYEEYAAFGNVTYYFNPNVDITLGSRVSHHRMDLDVSSSGGLSGGNAPIKAVEDTVDTWLVAARYRPTEDISLYVRVASGYRPASANILRVDAVTGENLAQQPLNSDSVWSYELGAKGRLLQGYMAYDLGLWHLKWDDFRTFVAINTLNTLANADGGITAQGAEGSFTFKPLQNLSLTSTFSYTQSTLDKDEPGLFGRAGQQVPTVPEWTLSTRVRYDFTPFADSNAYIGGGLRYTGETRTAFSDQRSFDPAVGPTAITPVNTAVNIPTEDIILVDFNAGVTVGATNLSLHITNLLNEQAYSSVGGSLVAGVSPPLVDVTAVPVRPRTIGLVLSYEF